MCPWLGPVLSAGRITRIEGSELRQAFWVTERKRSATMAAHDEPSQWEALMRVDSWVRGSVVLPATAPELPVYRAVLAVDVKDFGSVLAADHHRLTEMIPAVLERAF